MPLDPLKVARDAVASAQKHPAVAIAGGVAVLVGATLIGRMNQGATPIDAPTDGSVPTTGTGAGGVYGLGYSPGLGLDSGGSIGYGYGDGLGGGYGGGAGALPPDAIPPIVVPPIAPPPIPIPGTPGGTPAQPVAPKPAAPKPAGAVARFSANGLRRLYTVKAGVATEHTYSGLVFSAWIGPTAHYKPNATLARILSGSHAGLYVRPSDGRVTSS